MKALSELPTSDRESGDLLMVIETPKGDVRVPQASMASGPTAAKG